MIATQLIVSTLSLGFTATVANAASAAVDTTAIDKVISWIKSDKKGILNPSVELGQDGGFFATSEIEEGEIILSVPSKFILRGNDVYDDEHPGESDLLEWNCGAIEKLEEELEKGNDSFYAPYLQYLQSSLTDITTAKLPSYWSKEGKALLVRILNQQDMDITNDFHPESVVSWLDVDEVEGTCETFDKVLTPEQKQMIGMSLQYGFQGVMVPLLDRFRHRNGKYWLNTKQTTVHSDKKAFVLKANRDINAGEEIYKSFNECGNDCKVKQNLFTYGTAEIFRDYGIIENFPQKWYFGNEDQPLHFELYQAFDQNGLPTDKIKLKWDEKNEEEESEAIVELNLHLLRLKSFGKQFASGAYSMIPQGELNAIKAYYDAIIYAATTAIQYFEDHGCDEDDEECVIERRYDTLTYQDDEIDHAYDTCDTGISLSKEGYETVDSINNMYHNVSFSRRTSDGDTCLIIDGVTQICTSYRPQYHETGVHFTSQFLPEMKRVVFVGGGDSMLLHEFLKFPSVEMVLGLELDQTVVRYSFKHFGSQPHFDNPKEGYETVDSINNMYHNVSFTRKISNGDTCLIIDGITQICTSYRPQYHETGVHFTSQFLPEMKRVVFVGGGDSMLLHEFLKFPSVEMVLGLELDQTVVRYSFKHFGSQPHFDNPKAQWWFGDASKSLLMLPKELYGTIDMVLMDLSETVMSLSVTDEFDIMQALALLLKPEGVLVKNENYMEPLSNIFEHVLQGVWLDVPVTCTQTYNLGSNSINFLKKQSPIEHELNDSILYLDRLGHDRTVNYHSYKRNFGTRPCQDDDDDDDDDLPTRQNRSPGILMILELEKCALSLSNPSTTKSEVENAIIRTGFRLSSSSLKDSASTIFMREGYIVLRAVPDAKYVGFDIHLWASFDKHEKLRDEITKSFGGSASSFRVVAGGIFGIDTWKQDDMKRGPKVTEKCQDEGTEFTPAEEITEYETMLVEGLTTLTDSKVVFGVLCGSEEEACPSNDIIRKHDAPSNVITLWECEDIVGESEYDEDIADKMKACEDSIEKMLDAEVKKNGPMRAFIIDPSTSFLFGQIAHRILSSERHHLMTENIFIFAVGSGEDDEWRRNLMDRFRVDVVLLDPVFRSEVLFNDTKSEESMEMGIMSSGDDAFVYRLQDAIERIEEKSGLVPEVRNVLGGQAKYLEDWKAAHVYLPEDWNMRDSLDQYMSQQPTGYQTIFQMGIDEEEEPESANVFKEAVVEVLSALSNIVKDGYSGMSDSSVELYEVGKGCTVSAMWSGGNCIVLWDGDNHVDLNLFTEVESEELADEFMKELLEFEDLPTMHLMLRDTQPRGYGRVVNFQRDLVGRSGDIPPRWAKVVE
eukprot:CAMPEP_0202474902 /NCGR_PEP_ID=MMETSP1360-20130828/92621_1 /ASSEMBLY_ACC=CAM_ASM_000848 /TAXON_ID=515479 /ORGANISM="Licmophora paradoxa, Strain CCMP2313" /LENGTH=1346 /DNA_ID=CAMNT_0049102047 /DNA_START=198 /DNA_END=4238 /DNA_ORIENTATION=+